MNNSANIIFTICSNNYLAKAKVLYNSVCKHEPSSRFIIFLCDIKADGVNYADLAHEVILLNEVEPLIDELALKYTLVELNTCIKPRLFEYLLFERNAGKVIFLDPDIKLYNSLNNIYESLASYAIVLTPHICTPILLDGKLPGENMFNNFGIYNLGFIGLSADAGNASFLTWWKKHTYNQCYIDVYNGIFVDQLPINQAPIFFEKVGILKDMGLNMAPWNLHERFLNTENDVIYVNNTTRLTFYHFSSFTPGRPEITSKYYNRFALADRADLVSVYQQYDLELQNASHNYFKELKCCYALNTSKIKKAKWGLKIKGLFK